MIVGAINQTRIYRDVKDLKPFVERSNLKCLTRS